MIYLDNAATSFPKPPEVLRGAFEFASHWCGNAGRSGHRLSMQSSNVIEDCREAICELFGYDHPENVVFTSNATYAINLAINSYYRSGSKILISDLEHNAVIRPLESLKRRGLVSYSIFSHTGSVTDNIKRAIERNTDMVICTHVSNVDGTVLPIREIGDTCKAYGLRFIVDASQSAGHMDIELKNMYFTAFCAPGHKGLLGLQGSGFVILNDENILRDFVQGGGGTDAFSGSMPHYLPDRFEAGTQNAVAINSMGLGIRYLISHGLTDMSRLCMAFRYELSKSSMIKIYSSEDTRAGIVSFIIPGASSFDIAEYLSAKDICVRGGYHCAPLTHKTFGTEDTGLVRVSFGRYNTVEQISNVAAELRKYCAQLSK